MTSTAHSITESDAQASARHLAADPLGPILSLGEREVRVGLILGILGALLLHTAVGLKAASTLGDIHAFAVLVRAEIRERTQAQVDVDLSEPPTPPPAPNPEPEPEPPQHPPPATARAPQTDVPPPPAAAQAGKVLTQDPDPNEPVDLTGDGFVSGTSDRFAGGVTAANGTATNAVRDLRAQPD